MSTDSRSRTPLALPVAFARSLSRAGNVFQVRSRLAWRLTVRRGLVYLLTTTAAHAAIPDTERQALLDLYTSTNGDGWITRTGWNTAAGTECGWFGVTCDDPHSHVTTIQLPGNNLSGTLPSLTPLTSLETFDVDTNKLTGSIPPLIDLPNLGNFLAYNNQLTGSIPTLAGSTQLSYFYVYNNKLSGTIPDLTDLPTLCHFNLSGNQLTGSIPSLTQISNLVVFNVSSNQLTGNVPALTGLSGLSLFNIGGNKLTGPVPAAPDPSNLQAGGSGLCPNSLTLTANTDWNSATGNTPWWAVPDSTNLCDDVFANGFD
jgi:Leucine-rich repeat (LRR) protein